MPHYRVLYFDVRGRAEPTRLLLTLAGADWEDVRVTDFAALKEEGNLPFGQLPVLEVDGKLIGQSMANLRFIAKEHGFVPPTNLQTAIADSIIDQIQDMIAKVIKVHLEKDPVKKDELEKDAIENVILKNMKFFEKIRKEYNGGKGPFFFGDKITYADVHFFDFCNSMMRGVVKVPDWLSKDFPDLARLYEGVMNEPAVLDYLKKRPASHI